MSKLTVLSLAALATLAGCATEHKVAPAPADGGPFPVPGSRPRPSCPRPTASWPGRPSPAHDIGGRVGGNGRARGRDG